METITSHIQLRPIEEKDNMAIAAIIRAVLTEFNAAKRGTVYYDPTTDDYIIFSKKKKRFILLQKKMVK